MSTRVSIPISAMTVSAVYNAPLVALRQDFMFRAPPHPFRNLYICLAMYIQYTSDPLSCLVYCLAFFAVSLSAVRCSYWPALFPTNDAPKSMGRMTWGRNRAPLSRRESGPRLLQGSSTQKFTRQMSWNGSLLLGYLLVGLGFRV